MKLAFGLAPSAAAGEWIRSLLLRPSSSIVHSRSEKVTAPVGAVLLDEQSNTARGRVTGPASLSAIAWRASFI